MSISACTAVQARQRAATRVCALVRMFLMRRRYGRLQAALKRWRIIHSAAPMQCLRTEIFRQKQLQVSSNTKLLWTHELCASGLATQKAAY